MIKCLICDNARGSFPSGKDESVGLMRAVVVTAGGTALMKLGGLL